MASVLIVLAICFVASVLSQVPIPKREVGFVYNFGNANAPVHLDFYIDLICPDSKQALPVIIKVADVYGPETLQLRSHIFPLPYHRLSFYASKGVHIVNNLTKGNLTYAWLRRVYDNIDSLTNKATLKMSDEQVVAKLAKIAEGLGISSSKFKMLIFDENIEENTRVGWKYCCTRGVAATPTFMVNDVVVAASPSWTVDQWRQVIDPLIGQPARLKLNVNVDCPPGIKKCEFLPGKFDCCKKVEFCVPNVGCRC